MKTDLKTLKTTRDYYKAIVESPLELRPIDIDRFKANLTRRYERQLKIDKAHGDASKAASSSLDYDIVTYELFSDQAKIQEDIKTLSELQGLNIQFEGKTYDSGRYDYYKQLNFKVKIPRIMPSIDEEYIKKQAKIMVTKAIYGKEYRSWRSPDCGIMALFKEGKISWYDVVTRHHAECNL